MPDAPVLFRDQIPVSFSIDIEDAMQSHPEEHSIGRRDHLAAMEAHNV
jgi:hypothetical protein